MNIIQKYKYIFEVLYESAIIYEMFLKLFDTVHDFSVQTDGIYFCLSCVKKLRIAFICVFKKLLRISFACFCE